MSRIEPTIDLSYQPTCEDWLSAAEGLLREIRENTDIGDPHFRHWAHVKILSYFSAKGEVPGMSPTVRRNERTD